MTLEQFNHLKKVFFIKSKELNDLQKIIEDNTHLFQTESKKNIEILPKHNKIKNTRNKKKNT